MLLRLLILVIQLKKLTITQKLIKLKRKLLIMIMVNITTQEFKKLTSENFAARLAQTNLTSKNDTSALVKRRGFDDKSQNLNKKVTSNKTKHIQAELI